MLICRYAFKKIIIIQCFRVINILSHDINRKRKNLSFFSLCQLANLVYAFIKNKRKIIKFE